MGLRETVEAGLSVSDQISVERLKDIIANGGIVTPAQVVRMATVLMAYLTTPDPENQDMDDLRMKVVGAEVEADNANDSLAECRRFLSQIVADIDNRIAVRGDMEIADMKRMKDKIERFVS